MSKFTDIVKAAAAYINPSYANKLRVDKEIADLVKAKTDISDWIGCGLEEIDGRNRQACFNQLELMQCSKDDITEKLGIIAKVDYQLAENLRVDLACVEEDLLNVHRSGKTQAELESEVEQARFSLDELIFNSDNILAVGDRDACRTQAESFERDDASIQSDLATIRKADSYTADRLGRELDIVRSNLISQALYGLSTWHAIDAGHTIPATLPPSVAAKPTAHKL